MRKPDNDPEKIKEILIIMSISLNYSYVIYILKILF